MSEVAKRTGLSRAAVRRFLHTLVELGYVAVDGRYYELRPRVLDLGYAYLSSLPFFDVVRPVLHQVTQQINATCSASVLDGSEIVTVVRAQYREAISVTLGVGGRMPAFATSMGRVLIAALPPDAREPFIAGKVISYTDKTVTAKARLRSIFNDVATEGFSLVDQEYLPGITALAVPVRDRTGRVVAALASTVRSGRVDLEMMRTVHRSVLTEASRKITHALHLSG